MRDEHARAAARADRCRGRAARDRPARDACPPGARATLGAIAAAGPRARADPGEYELLIETIYEGYLLHYGVSRLLSDADADLSLLAGDRLYALGLERLVALGDLEAVRELADVIALCALLVGRGEGEAARRSGWPVPRRSDGAPAESYAGRRRWCARATPAAATALRALADSPCQGMTVFFALARFPRSVIGTHAQAQQVKVHR